MHVEGRIYDPTSGTWVTNDFRIGNVAVDGSDGADVPTLSVIQLAGGNVVVGWARNNVETGNAEPVYTVLDQNGATVFSTAEVEGADTESQWTVWESPPVLHALDDGRFLALWVNDGYSDDLASMTLEGRIFNADGTPATGDFRIGSKSVDGFDGFDNDHISVVTLGNGNVVISCVENSGTSGDGSTHSHFTILNTTANGTPVISDVRIPQAPDHPYSGPAELAALGNSGYFVAVFAEGDAAFGTKTGLNYRIFNSNGTAVTGDVPLVLPNMAEGVNTDNGFDWDNFSVVYSSAARSFTVAWVGNDDGTGTGAFSSGPINVSSYVSDGVVDGTAGNDTMTVSPQHAILLRDTDGEERLFRAIHLSRLRGGGVRQKLGARKVTYVHLMFDRHQILRSGGLWSESFYPGPQALGTLSEPALRELQAIFPGLTCGSYGPQARHIPRSRDLPDRLRDLRRLS